MWKRKVTPLRPQHTSRLYSFRSRCLSIIHVRLLIAVVILAGIGAAYQAIATAHDARAFPPPGQLVDVGGYKVQTMRCWSRCARFTLKALA